MVYLHVSEVL